MSGSRNIDASRTVEIDLRNAVNFARSLNLQPTLLQKQILEKFDIIEDFTSICDGRQEIARAFALGMLWQTLSTKGSRSTILSSEPELGRHVMSFLHAAIKQGPDRLKDICNFGDWAQVSFGADPGWNITLIRHFSPGCLDAIAKRGVKTRTALILKESSSEVDFINAKNALTGAMTHKQRRIIHLW